MSESPLGLRLILSERHPLPLGRGTPGHIRTGSCGSALHASQTRGLDGEIRPQSFSYGVVPRQIPIRRLPEPLVLPGLSVTRFPSLQRGESALSSPVHS